jgi:hypothetical protein
MAEIIKRLLEKWQKRGVYFTQKSKKNLIDIINMPSPNSFDILIEMDKKIEESYESIYNVILNTERGKIPKPLAIAKIDRDKEGYKIRLLPPPDIVVDYSTGELIERETGRVLSHMPIELLRDLSLYEIE